MFVGSIVAISISTRIYFEFISLTHCSFSSSCLRPGHSVVEFVARQRKAKFHDLPTTGAARAPSDCEQKKATAVLFCLYFHFWRHHFITTTTSSMHEAKARNTLPNTNSTHPHTKKLEAKHLSMCQVSDR